MVKNNKHSDGNFPELRLNLTQGGEVFMPKKLEEIKQTKTLQLSLFELLTENDVLTEEGNRQLRVGKNYSQTIELYDFMPRFVWKHQADLRKNYNGLLPALVRDFECRGVPFRLTLAPATLVNSKGESISHYPGADEDILETVLRKIYLDGNPKLFDGQPGLVFTVNQLRKEMKAQGHTRSHNQILESLLILKGSQINVQNLENGTKLLFNTVDILSYNEKNAGDTPCYLIFSKLLADALDQLYFRRMNYKQVVQYKSPIARLLHRRISHHFTQANEELHYTVNLSTLLRDFGLEYPTVAKAIYNFKLAVEEIKEAGVIKEFKPDPIVSTKDRRKIEDYYLQITPTKNFSFEMRNSNLVRQNVEKIVEQLGEETLTKPAQKRPQPSIFPDSLHEKSPQDKKNKG